MKFENYVNVKQVCSLICENADPDKIANYISHYMPSPSGEDLGTLFADVSKRLVPERVTSHFLGDLFNSIAGRIGKKIVLPERGGQEFRFGSTRDQHKINWNDIESRQKQEQLFNLAKYYQKYPNGKDLRTNLSNSIEFDKNNVSARRAVTNVINKVLKRIEGDDQSSEDMPLRNAALQTKSGIGSSNSSMDYIDYMYEKAKENEPNARRMPISNKIKEVASGIIERSKRNGQGVPVTINNFDPPDANLKLNYYKDLMNQMGMTPKKVDNYGNHYLISWE